MARKSKTSPAEDLLDLVSMLPWWGGALLAVISYLVLHAVAERTVVASVQAGQMGQYMSTMLWKAFANFGQYILPLICLGGAALSAWRRKQRTELLVNVAKSDAANALDGISWQEFEMLVGESFRQQGYQVVETGGNGPDGGVDLVLHKSGEVLLVQCKQWKAYKVGVEVVRELYGVMAARGAAGGFLVTSGRFTDAATRFAQGRNVKLIDGPILMKLIRQAKTNPAKRERAGVTISANAVAMPIAELPLCPQCSKEMVRRTAKKGAHAGNAFWGCVAYPSCKGTRPI